MKVSLLVLTFSLAARAAAPVTLANFPNSMVYAVQTDATGNLYVAGFQGNFSKANPFVAKLSPSGQTLYSTTFTGSNFGIAWALAVDASGDAYVFGNTNSADFPVTAGALQTTASQSVSQGFVAKLDPNGKVVYSTFLGGNGTVTPGLTSAPGLNSILVDSAGDAIVTGQFGPGATGVVFPPAPAPSVSSAGTFVVKLDPTGSKILGGIRGIGGMIAMDGAGNIYVSGIEYGSESTPLAPTANGFQSAPANVCGTLGAFFTCGYQYVAKVNAGLTQVAYATYVSGEYGATPAAMWVDAQGDAFVVGNTNSPDYPTTANAYEPQYIAHAGPPAASCFFSPHCVNLPPSTGYVTEVNPTGTGLIYSSYYGGTTTDSINFAALTGNGVYLGGNAGSADLPGFTGYPQQCLPQTYETRLSADLTEIGPAHVTPGKVLAYDSFAGTLIVSNGTSVVAVDPNAAETPISCILDSADLKPVTSIAPGELLSLFGAFATGTPAAAGTGQLPTTLDAVSVSVNGTASGLLYAGGGQINFQAPTTIAAGGNATIKLTSSTSSLSDSLTLPVVASNPTAFLVAGTVPTALATCNAMSSASVNGLLPLALNADGSMNTCLTPAPAGSTVTVFLNGPAGSTAPAVTVTAPLTVKSVTALAGTVAGVWQVTLQIPAGTSGGTQVTLTAGGAQVRDVSLVIWVK